MSAFARTIATVGELGCSRRAPGTLGSVVGWLAGALLAQLRPELRWSLLAAGVLIGVDASTKTERAMRVHDPSSVIIDEVLGMAAIFAWMPGLARHFWAGLIGFGFFRLFDVVKPPPLKWLAQFPAGWGIVLDDLGAAAYTCLVLEILRQLVT